MTWRKATRCDSGTCVEFDENGARGAKLRDSKLGDESPVIQSDGDAWRDFLTDVRRGRYDR